MKKINWIVAWAGAVVVAGVIVVVGAAAFGGEPAEPVSRKPDQKPYQPTMPSYDKPGVQDNLARIVQETENRALDVVADLRSAMTKKEFDEQLEEQLNSLQTPIGFNAEAAKNWCLIYVRQIEDYEDKALGVINQGPQETINRVVRAYEALIRQEEARLQNMADIAKNAKHVGKEAKSGEQTMQRIIEVLKVRVQRLQGLSFSTEIEALEEQLTILTELKQFAQELHDGLLDLLHDQQAVEVLANLKSDLGTFIRQFDRFGRGLEAAELVIKAKDSDLLSSPLELSEASGRDGG